MSKSRALLVLFVRNIKIWHFIRILSDSGEHLALKPPFWLLSLPLFLVLYRNTAAQPQGDDKRDDDCEGDLEDERGDRDGEDTILEGALNREDRIGDDDFEDERGDRNGDGEDKIVEGDLNREDKIGDDDLESKRGQKKQC